MKAKTENIKENKNINKIKDLLEKNIFFNFYLSHQMCKRGKVNKLGN